ncbi:MAG: hypothetical protein ACKO34_08945 [Vampirovibrionales bacterium]
MMSMQVPPTGYNPTMMQQRPVAPQPKASSFTMANYVGQGVSPAGTEVSKQAMNHAESAKQQGDAKTAELDNVVALFANPVYFYTAKYEEMADKQKAQAAASMATPAPVGGQRQFIG